MVKRNIFDMNLCIGVEKTLFNKFSMNIILISPKKY